MATSDWNGLPAKLREYINDEMSDSMYYRELAAKAPTRASRELLMEFSREEMTHAENFMEAYYRLTHREYRPENVERPIVPEYEEALRQRIMAETKDYEKYGIQYLKAPDQYFRNLFFETRTVEAQHAMRIPILLHDEHMMHHMMSATMSSAGNMGKD
ncbi:MAG: ferritin-like domain-containing protein [Acidobacteriota bacterium]